MKVKYLNYFMILCGSLFASTTYAEQIQQSEIEKLKLEVSELKALYQVMIESKDKQEVMIQPSISSNNPQLQSHASVNLYGFIRADMAYQFEGAKAIFNSPHTISLETDKDKHQTEDRFDTTLTTTRIGLDFNTPLQDNFLKGKIEVDFRGGTNRDTVRLRHVYMNYGHWLVGQTTSTFLSTETAPEMLDFNTALGGGTTRTPMIRYTGDLDNNNQYFISLEKGHDENRLPLLATKLKYNFDHQHRYLTLRGMIQEVRLRDLEDKTELGWGVGLGLRYKITEPLVLNANYSHVSGDNKILLATSDHSRYMLNEQQDIELIKFDAFQVGLNYQITQKLKSSIGYGGLIYSENNAKANKKLQQKWMNLMYNPFKSSTIGVEYIHGSRETILGEKGTDSRIGMMARYHF